MINIDEIENAMKQKAIEKKKKANQKLLDEGKVKDSIIGRKLISECIKITLPLNEAWFRAVTTNKQIAKNKRYTVNLFENGEPLIPFETISAIAAEKTLSCLLNTQETTIDFITKKIGKSIDNELLYLHFKKHHKKYLDHLEVNILKNENQSIRFLMENLNTFNRRIDTDKYKHLTSKEQTKIGLVLLENLRRNTGYVLRGKDYFCPLFVTEDNGEGKKRIRPTSTLIEWCKFSIDVITADEVKYEPTTYKPIDFVDFQQGGYKTIVNPLNKTQSKEYLRAVNNEEMGKLYRCVNVLQSTAYEVHTKTFETVDYFYRNGLELKTKSGGDIIPSRAIGNDHITRTEEIENALILKKEQNELYKKHAPKSKIITEFNKKNKAELLIAKSYKAAIKRQIIKENSNKGKLTQYAFGVDQTARALLNQAFYLPSQLDSRGRQYYKPFFNPQSTDFIKGLFTFATKHEISTDLKSDELQEFFCQGANEFGFDKAIDAKKAEWVIENIDKIYNVSQDPLNENSFWREADKPIMFLNFCFEFEKYVKAVNKGETHFKSGIIRFLDGKCNGLQNLSAMSLDKNAGKLVALIDEDLELEDIYQKMAKTSDELLDLFVDKTKVKKYTVKKKVKNETVEKTELRVELNGVTSAMLEEKLIYAKKWRKFKGIPRDIAKQPTMTLAYNSKRMGRMEQVFSALTELGEKGKDVHFDYSEFKSGSGVMADLMADSSKIVMPEIISMMRKMEAAVKLFCKYTTDTAVTIKSPYFNYPFVQRYMKTKRERIKVSHEGTEYYVSTEVELDSKISIEKMMNAIIANLTHMFDVTHEMMTVYEMDKLVENIDFCAVHDSFGTSPKYSKITGRVIREQFVKLHTENCGFSILKDGLISSSKGYFNKEISKVLSEDNKRQITSILEASEVSDIEYYTQLVTELELQEIRSSEKELKEEMDRIILKKGDLDLNSVLTSHRFFS